MRKKIKELYEHSTLVAKIRYSYLCLLVPFVLFLIFCFYNLWNNNRRYEDMINSSVMASQFSLDFQKDFDYETYLLIVGNKTLEESSLHDMLVEADDIVAGLEELTESQENLKRLTSVKKYLNNLETYIGRIEDNIREGNRYEDNMEIWENDVQIVTSLVGDTMSQYIYYEIRGIQESRQQYQDFFVNMIRFSIIAFTLILVLFLFLSYYIPLSITSPIRRLTQVTDQVAKGDLTVRSDVTGGVEAQVLSDSLNTMIDKINELLEQILKRTYAIEKEHNDYTKTPEYQTKPDKEPYEDVSPADKDKSSADSTDATTSDSTDNAEISSGSDSAEESVGAADDGSDKHTADLVKAEHDDKSGEEPVTAQSVRREINIHLSGLRKKAAHIDASV